MCVTVAPSAPGAKSNVPVIVAPSATFCDASVRRRRSIVVDLDRQRAGGFVAVVVGRHVVDREGQIVLGEAGRMVDRMQLGDRVAAIGEVGQRNPQDIKAGAGLADGQDGAIRIDRGGEVGRQDRADRRQQRGAGAVGAVARAPASRVTFTASGSSPVPPGLPPLSASSSQQNLRIRLTPTAWRRPPSPRRSRCSAACRRPE